MRKHKIIEYLFNSSYFAHIHYGFGADKNLRKRAYVTYISTDHDQLFPNSHTMKDLREKVSEFIKENDLIIEMEQCTDKRFNYHLHGHDQSNCNIDDEGRIFDKDGTFITPSMQYRK